MYISHSRNIDVVQPIWSTVFLRFEPQKVGQIIIRPSKCIMDWNWILKKTTNGMTYVLCISLNEVHSRLMTVDECSIEALCTEMTTHSLVRAAPGVGLPYWKWHTSGSREGYVGDRACSTFVNMSRGSRHKSKLLTFLLKLCSFSDTLEISCRSLCSSSLELGLLFNACGVRLPCISWPCCVLHSSTGHACESRLDASLHSLSFSLLCWCWLSDRARCCFLLHSASCSLSSSLSLASQSMELSESVADILGCLSN